MKNIDRTNPGLSGRIRTAAFFLLCLAGVLCASHLRAETPRPGVKGIVTTTDGPPLAGVTVIVGEGPAGTTTDVDGRF